MESWEDFAMKKVKKAPAKKPKKSVRKAAPAVKTKLLNLRVTGETFSAMQKCADRFANGNLSKWLRTAGVSYKPAKS